MDKHIAVVTGANRGIGFEIAHQLARRGGIRVVLGSRDAAKGPNSGARSIIRGQLFWKARASMPTSLAELEKQAIELPLPERAQLITSLIASLDTADEGDVEAAWAAEAERRLAEFESGKIKAVLADEVLREARRKLRERYNSSHD